MGSQETLTLNPFLNLTPLQCILPQAGGGHRVAPGHEGGGGGVGQRRQGVDIQILPGHAAEAVGVRGPLGAVAL